MRRVLLIASVLVTLGAACKKAEKREPPADKPKETPAATAGSAAAAPVDAARRVEIEAGKDGYVPDRIVGKPGEKLTLVFKRTIEGECLAKLKAPDGKEHELPMNKPYEIAVTVPASGELAFACGMDMFKGVIVAQPAG